MNEAKTSDTDKLCPSQTTMKTEDVKQKVRQGLYTLYPKQNMRSHVWESFRVVFNDLGEEIFGISCCVKCQTCLRYKSIKNGKSKDFGTKNLRDHIQFCGVQRKRGRKADPPNPPSDVHLQGNEISNYKFHPNCESFPTNTSSINDLVTPSEVKSVVDSICKVERLEDGFLDDLSTEGTQIDSHMTPEVTQIGDSVPPPVGVASSPKVAFLPPSFKRIRILGKAPLTPPVTGNDPHALGHSCPSAGHLNSSGATPSKAPKEDEHDVFGRHVANELRSLPDDINRRWARFQIQKVLFDAHSCPKDS